MHQQGAAPVLPSDEARLHYDSLLSELVAGHVDDLHANLSFSPPSWQKGGDVPATVAPSDCQNTHSPWKARINDPLQGDPESSRRAGSIRWGFARWASMDIKLSGASTKRSRIGLEYHWPVGWGGMLGDYAGRFLDLRSLRLRGEWSRMNTNAFGPSFGGFAGATENRPNPQSMFNFYATLPSQDGKWALRFFARNLSSTSSVQSRAPRGYAGESAGDYPRLLGVDLTYRF
jgi:hypothetical protein